MEKYKEINNYLMDKEVSMYDLLKILGGQVVMNQQPVDDFAMKCCDGNKTYKVVITAKLNELKEG